MARFLESFTRDLVDDELGPLPPDLTEGAVDWVQARVAGAGDVTRLGLRVASTAVAAGVRLRTGHAYGSLPDAERRVLAARIARSRLPIVGELTKAVRSLAITYVYEARFATAP